MPDALTRPLSLCVRLRRVAFCLVVVAVVTAGSAQTATKPEVGSADGVYTTLTPLNQRIARALFKAQMMAPRSGTATAETPLTLDRLASMKTNGQSWERIFLRMKSQGLVREEEFRQVLARYYRPPRLPVTMRSPGSDQAHPRSGEAASAPSSSRVSSRLPATSQAAVPSTSDVFD